MTGRRPPDGHVTIGQVVGPHGIKGGVRVKVLTDFTERFDLGAKVWLAGEERTVKHASWHKEQVRLVLSGIPDRNAAEDLKWEYVSVPESDQPELDEDEFLTSDLFGLKVVTTEGKTIGRISDVISNPVQDVLVVGKTLIPMVKQFVKDINLKTKTVTVELIDGMWEE